ncbi:MAG: UDP-N-acetylmuramate dehydrogenase [Armatimonadetes bacterium]|nr:UDP-N-acetylmuramate dehydrogenase [Armatimonadota bacterium]
MNWEIVERQVPIKTYTTLKAGGNAEYFSVARTAEDLRKIAEGCQQHDIPLTPLGWGSNVLPADKGVPGMIAVNLASNIDFGDDGVVTCDSGTGFQNLFLQCAQRSLGGLEFAVGIPGSVGGALVSNAGAYRSDISEFLVEIEITHGGTTQWVDPSWMQFSYRDSVLRKPDPVSAVIQRVRMRLPEREPKFIYDEAREYQRQRIGKQPPSASAGSFFKNVVSEELSQRIEGLTEGMRKNRVVPAGFLIEACGLKGFRLGGAMIGSRHANFLLNVSGATATELRSLAHYAKISVQERFGVELEEEVLYLGDWTNYEPIRP